MMTFVLICSWGLQTTFRPYKYRQDNILEICSLMGQLVFTLDISLRISGNREDGETRTLEKLSSTDIWVR